MKTWFSGETDRIFDFYKAAADHILLSGDMEDMVYACHPDVRSTEYLAGCLYS